MNSTTGVAEMGGLMVYSDAFPEVQGNPTDDEWATRVAGALRARGVDEHTITSRLDEARTHAHDAGVSLFEEFGSPEGFAAQMPGSPRRTALWSAIASTVCLVIQVILLLMGSRHGSWWYLLLLLFAAFTAREWHRAGRAGRSR